MVRPQVVLPQPDSPTRPRVSPLRMSEGDVVHRLAAVPSVADGEVFVQVSGLPAEMFFAHSFRRLPLSSRLSLGASGCCSQQEAAWPSPTRSLGGMLLLADVHAVLAAGSKGAALGRDSADRAACPRWCTARSRAAQRPAWARELSRRLGIGVARCGRRSRSTVPRLHDLAGVHDRDPVGRCRPPRPGRG